MIYQLKVLLSYSKPPIWRRLEVEGSTTLSQLHWIIQIAMGWTNSHLHQFIIDREFYAEPLPFDDGWGAETHDSHQFSLEQLLQSEGDRFIYEYDFGDSWSHLIEVEKITEPKDNTDYPKCIKGKMACPPEDVGGIPGYENFVEAKRDKSHPDHEMYSEWYLDDFDPKAFNIDEVNTQLARYIEQTTGRSKKNKTKKKSKKQSNNNSSHQKVIAIHSESVFDFTQKQGQYLSFIFYYGKVTGYAPTQSDIANYFGVSQPAVSNMLKNLEKKGWIGRESGQVVSLNIPREYLPELV